MRIPFDGETVDVPLSDFAWALALAAGFILIVWRYLL